MTWQAFLFVGIGGFFGANVRYALSLWLNVRLATATGWQLPFGTAFVNITGSFLLALFLVWAAQRSNMPDALRLAIGTGFFGAYTTFSTYANEGVSLFSTDWRTGLGYIIVTNGLCLLGVVLGIALANRLWLAT